MPLKKIVRLHLKKPDTAPKDTEENTAAQEDAPVHSNYIFALKLLGILVAIIAVIVILQASGVRFSMKDLFWSNASECVLPLFPF